MMWVTATWEECREKSGNCQGISHSQESGYPVCRFTRHDLPESDLTENSVVHLLTCGFYDIAELQIATMNQSVNQNKFI